ADAVNEAVTKSRRARLAAECLVSVQQLAAFPLPRVALADACRVDLLEVVFRGRRQAELVADEILEHRPAVAADGAVGLVRNQQVKVGGREKAAVLVVE